MIPPFEEATATTGVSQDSLTAEDGACTRLWRTAQSYTVSDPQDVIDAERYFVGETATGVHPSNPGKVQRTLPAPDPQHITWWCRRLNSVKGIADRSKAPDGYVIDLDGKDALLAAGVVPLLKTILPGYALYPQYEFNVTMGPRNYSLVGDDKITVYTSKPDGSSMVFYWPDGQTTGPYYYADEWKRFCSKPKYAPQNDYVTATAGMFVFRCANAAMPDRYAFSGMPRILLRTDVVTIEWFNVPYRYLSSPRSYIRRFRGLINQYPWYGNPGSEMFGPGALLYLTYSYSDYASPANVYETAFPGSGLAPEVKGAPQLCNVTFTFLHTDRKADNPITPAWRGWVTDGMNALPWFGNPGRFYYATSPGVGLGAANPTQWFPMFNSFPIELLFTDPDAPQLGGAANPLANPGQGGI